MKMIEAAGIIRAASAFISNISVIKGLLTLVPTL